MAPIDLQREEMEEQLRNDLQTLRMITAGLEALEARWNDARAVSGALARGYFTPEEDDRVRQMVLAYRNYRVALHEIIFRCWPYPHVPWPDLQLRMFLLGFATGLTVYSKSLKLINSYERVPLIRAKINEPDSKWELESGFFEQVLGAYSSLSNYRGIAAGTWFWLQHRRQLQRELRRGDADSKWLGEVILRERAFTRKRLTDVLVRRLRYDWRLFLSTVLSPVRKTQYNIKSLIGSAGARLRTTGHYRPSLKPSVVSRLNALLKPGDVLLIRAEKKLTSAILPGFWSHAALFIGTRENLAGFGISSHPHVGKHLPLLESKTQVNGGVIEAVSPFVQLVPLQRALFADHVLVLRPKVNQEQIAAALVEAFSHIGKPYDFEFDFNVTTRMVCTGLIYRCYQHKGGINFSLIKRLGRFTLSGDDVATAVIQSFAGADPAKPPPFDITALVLSAPDGEVQFVEPSQAATTLARIQEGWRPGAATKSVNA